LIKSSVKFLIKEIGKPEKKNTKNASGGMNTGRARGGPTVAKVVLVKINAWSHYTV
jgi:hypothetical protein